MLHQFATMMLGLTIALLLFGIVALMADMHDRHMSRQRREGWRAHRAYMDSLEPQRWDA